jgi:arginyl-tRNA synthetase
MNILKVLQSRLSLVLKTMIPDPDSYSGMIRPAQDAKFGDYQVNCAMPLKAVLNKNPRDIATEIVSKLEWQDLFLEPEIAGPGFINFTLRSEFLQQKIQEMAASAHLGVEPAEKPLTIALDFSSPNVAKPMHVGHLRSSVIGDALNRILRYLGHTVISDNHIGDWGTQFGMIIYGYKHFLDQAKYDESPVTELARLYRFVNQLCDYHDAVAELPLQIQAQQLAAANIEQAKKSPLPKEKEQQKLLKKLQGEWTEAHENVEGLQKKIAAIEMVPELSTQAAQHPNIVKDSRGETAKLHAGDPVNRALWDKFLPYCLAAMESMYQRLGIKFDHTLGESFYQPMLGSVVTELKSKDLARINEGATCVFVEGHEAPLIIQKTDGAFTYGTTDLATIRYRVEEWKADAMYYVVDNRQSEHFNLLFKAARMWGYDKVDFRHISFGTVMGQDNKPYKTRAGDTVGLESLLDEAVNRARVIVDDNDNSKPNGQELSESARQQVAEIVGLGGVKYADLMHNRESNYIFDWDKMLANKGNTSTYIQYAVARIYGIFRRGEIDSEQLLQAAAAIQLTQPAERQLALQLFRFHEAIEEVTRECRPHLLCQYLFETAESLARFYDQCDVLKEADPAVKQSRLLLIDLVKRVLSQGLALLGIGYNEKM